MGGEYGRCPEAPGLYFVISLQVDHRPSSALLIVAKYELVVSSWKKLGEGILRAFQSLTVALLGTHRRIAIVEPIKWVQRICSNS